MMKKMIRLPLVLVLLFSSLIVMAPVQAETQVSTATDWIGDIEGVAFHIRVPEDWNGTLLVYAHGYSSTVPDPPDAAFNGDVFEEYLLDHGYALAASAYQNGGWALKEGVHDTLVLTNFFRDQVGEPQNIILYGSSMGGLIAAKSIEKFPGIYDAGIPMCGSMAGGTAELDSLLDFGLAYDVTIGWLDSWGTLEDVRDDVDIWDGIVYPVLANLYNPQNYGLHEFIRLVNDTTWVGFYLPPWNLTFWLQAVFMVYGRAEVEVRANGNPAQNIGRVYSLSEDEITYLEGLGVDAEGLLAEMNSHTTIAADPNARNYVKNNGDLTGRIRRPVLTMHTKYDVLTPVEVQGVYRDMVESAGSVENLVQVYTEGLQHCDFTPQQVLALVQAMEYWLESGNPPDAGFFPESLGFDNGFTPGP
jgi:pimeloyl-ACP methyl ester carboxylesterase